MTLSRTKRPQAQDAAPPVPLVTRISATQSVGMRFYLRELWARRSLVRVLAGRELKSQYEMNIVGFAWWLLEPLSLTLVYVIIVDFIFNRGLPAYPLFVLTALLPYKWLASALIGSMGTVRGHGNLITDVYFPRALLPLVEVMVGLAHFLVGMCIIPPLMFVYAGEIPAPTWHILWLPVIIAVHFLLILGLAYPLTVWGLYYRNLPGLATNVFRLWFYLSPSIWPLTRVENETFVTIIKFNPLTGIFVSLRSALMDGRAPGWELAWSAFVAVAFLLIGSRYYIKREAQFGKQI